MAYLGCPLRMAYEHWQKTCGGEIDSHSSEDLALFLEEIGKMAGKASNLVNQVKQLQGRTPASRVAWEQHCRRHQVPDPDPSLLVESFT